MLLLEEVTLTVEIWKDPLDEDEQPLGEEVWGRATAAAARPRATKDFIFRNSFEDR